VRYYKVLVLLVSLFLTSAFSVLAQEMPSAAQTAENLRAQLRDVEAQETELQARLQQLDWDLKPENIERHFSAVGTTRPEELREQRRRLLQHDKESVSSHLGQLAASRARLEAAISTADVAVYTQSAEWQPAQALVSTSAARQPASTLLLAGVLLLIAAAAWRFAAARRRRRRAG
jgi:chromosome segregation ATPase